MAALGASLGSGETAEALRSRFSRAGAGSVDATANPGSISPDPKVDARLAVYEGLITSAIHWDDLRWSAWVEVPTVRSGHAEGWAMGTLPNSF